MSANKSDNFISDVERQFEWYVTNAGWDVAERYLVAIEATIALIDQHPLLGPVTGFSHPRLQNWRFIVVFRPFHKHVLFYEVVDANVILRRAMHGHRDLPRHLMDPPGA